MGMFDSTPVIESPQGQEEMTAEPTQTETEEQITEPVEQQEEHEVQEESLEEETTEQEEAPSDEEQGDLIAGKFKSTDDLVKSYKELEKKFHQNRQQDSKPQSQQQTQQPQIQPQDDLNAVFQDYWEQNPAGVMQYAMQQMMDQRMKEMQEQYINPLREERQTEVLANDIGELSGQYGQLMTEDGLGSLFNQVQEIAAEIGNPDLAKNPTKRVLRMAAGELWGEPSKAAMYQKGKDEARQASEQTRRQKQALATKTTKKPKETPKTEEQIIQDRILNAGYRSGGIFG